MLHTIAESPCGLAELCERTGLPRATAHRLAAALEVHRLLGRDDEGRWRLGPAVTELAAHVNDPLLAASAAVLPAVARDHRRKRAAVPSRGHFAGLRGRRGTGCGPSRYGSGRGALADDGGFGRQSATGLTATRPPSGRTADGEIHRPGAGRSAPARLGAKRRRARSRGRERVGAGARRPRCGDRGDLGVRTHRPDGPASRGALGRRPTGRARTLAASDVACDPAASSAACDPRSSLRSRRGNRGESCALSAGWMPPLQVGTYRLTD